MPPRAPHLVLTVAGAIPDGMLFDASKPHAGCGICGAVFQSDYDRSGVDPYTATIMRTDWRIAHSRRHSQTEHRQLANSGLFALPEAAQKLASYGIIPLTDTVRHDEVSYALFESPRAPTDDADGC